MLDPEAIEVDPDLLLFNAAKAKSGNSGSRSVVLSDSRGRYAEPMLPQDRATYRRGCNLGRQRPTRRSGGSGNRADRDRGGGRSTSQVAAAQSRRPGGVSGGCKRFHGFEPDAERQGAVIRLLTEAYENRDEVALIPPAATRLKCCSPTRSITPPAPARIDALRR